MVDKACAQTVNPDDNHAMLPRNTRVAKVFHGVLYFGRIDCFIRAENPAEQALYHVQYDDGDEEDLDVREATSAVEFAKSRIEGSIRPSALSNSQVSEHRQIMLLTNERAATIQTAVEVPVAAETDGRSNGRSKPENHLCEYEMERAATIRRNQQVMQQLGVIASLPLPNPPKKARKQKHSPTTVTQPPRRSTRAAGLRSVGQSLAVSTHRDAALEGGAEQAREHPPNAPALPAITRIY